MSLFNPVQGGAPSELDVINVEANGNDATGKVGDGVSPIRAFQTAIGAFNAAAAYFVAHAVSPLCRFGVGSFGDVIPTVYPSGFVWYVIGQGIQRSFVGDYYIEVTGAQAALVDTGNQSVSFEDIVIEDSVGNPDFAILKNLYTRGEIAFALNTGTTQASIVSGCTAVGATLYASYITVANCKFASVVFDPTFVSDICGDNNPATVSAFTGKGNTLAANAGASTTNQVGELFAP